MDLEIIKSILEIIALLIAIIGSLYAFWQWVKLRKDAIGGTIGFAIVVAIGASLIGVWGGGLGVAIFGLIGGTTKTGLVIAAALGAAPISALISGQAFYNTEFDMGKAILGAIGGAIVGAIFGAMFVVIYMGIFGTVFRVITVVIYGIISIVIGWLFYESEQARIRNR